MKIFCNGTQKVLTPDPYFTYTEKALNGRVGMQRIKKSFILMLALVLSVLSVPIASPAKVKADTLGSITRFSPQTIFSRPRGITAGPDGNMWFAENNTHKIGKITPSGQITEYSLPTGYTKPEVIINGPGNSLWFTATGGQYVYSVIRMDVNGNFTNFYSLPNPLDRNNSPRGGFPNSYFSPNSMAIANGYVWVTRGYSSYLQRLTVGGDLSNVHISTPLENDYLPFESHDTRHVIADKETNSIIVSTYYNYPPYTGYIERIKADGSRVLHVIPSGRTANQLVIDNSRRIWFTTGDTSAEVGYMDTNGTFTFINLASADGVPGALTVGPDGNIWMLSPQSSARKVLRFDAVTANMTSYTVSGMQPTSYPVTAIASGSDGNVWFTEENTYNVSKVGAGTIGTIDQDGDTVTQGQELQQGTSDLSDDTDNDGLSDLTESQWFATRNDVFCNSTTSYCEYPDPLRKDLYVEIDWMDNTVTSTKPTSSQVASVEIALGAKNIRPHFDTGSLGGGNQVPYFSNVSFSPDVNDDSEFYDFKNGNSLLGAQFDSVHRYGVWHYMLVVPQIGTSTTVQGIAYSGDDDSMLAYETLQANHSSNFDGALANTMLHELGHNLCLTDDDPGHTYAGQDARCVFEGVDDTYSTNYESSMNYAFQYLIDFSDGTNGGNDHDDWTAIAFGLDDFVSQQVGDGAVHSTVSGKKVKKDPGKILKDYRKSNKKNLTPSDYRKPVVN